MPYRYQDLPRTLQRSEKGARETFTKAHDRAAETYGDGRRAHQTAYAALKHSYEKRGDRWVAKDEKGPSDPRAAASPARGERGGESFGGVDYLGSTKEELYARARELGIRGRSRMSKRQLARAIADRQ